MKKKTNNIKEADAPVDTSSTTGGSLPSSSTSTAANPRGTIFVKAKDVKKTDIDKTIKKAREYKVDVKVVENTMKTENKKLDYLSEIIDSETGEVSKPFTIAGKNYQMVRAIKPNKEKVTGVYCLDELNEDGTNKIYEIGDFEENIAKKYMNETGVAEPEAPEQSTLNPMDEKKDNPSFAGYKHFIVNEKSGKARKFKTIEELAKAQMGEGEKYMGVKEFKKFVDETLFGPARKQNVSEVSPTGQETDTEMTAKAQKLMAMIQKRIPEMVITSIKSNKLAQREVIAAFAEMIGVPRNGLAQLVTSIRDIAKPKTDKQQAPVSESKTIKVIKKKDIK